MATLMTSSVRATGILRLAEFFSEQARIGGPLANTLNEKAKVNAFEQFAVWLQSLARGIDRSADDAGLDERLLIAAEALSLVGKDRGAYAPSSGARRLISALKAPVDSPAVLVELIAVELADFRLSLVQREAAAQAARAERDAAVSALAEADQRLATVSAAREAAETALVQAQAELATSEARVEYLRLANATDEEAQEITAPPAVPSGTFPTAEQLESALTKRRVAIGQGGIELERRKTDDLKSTDTFYTYRLRGTVHKLGSATDGLMTVEQAVAAKARLTEGKEAQG